MTAAFSASSSFSQPLATTAPSNGVDLPPMTTATMSIQGSMALAATSSFARPSTQQVVRQRYEQRQRRNHLLLGFLEEASKLGRQAVAGATSGWPDDEVLPLPTPTATSVAGQRWQSKAKTTPRLRQRSVSSPTRQWKTLAVRAGLTLVSGQLMVFCGMLAMDVAHVAQQSLRLEQLHAHTVQGHQQLKSSIQGFHSNQQLEALARNELDMVVPGEVLVRLQ
ncbi:MAG: hypothetical protein ACKO34_08930 [Vampirovibrionales bacterium]